MIRCHVMTTANSLVVHYFNLNAETCGSGSSVSIATDYGLDGLGLNPGGVEIFHPSRLTLGPTQPPVEWVPGLSWGQKRQGHGSDPPIPI